MTTLQFLAEWALRSSILILSGTLLLRMLHIKDPSIRLAAWTAMLCGSLAIPALTASLPAVPLAIPRSAASPPAERSAAYETGRRPDHAVSYPGSYVDAAGPGTGASKPLDWALFAVITYVLIAGALLLRLGTGLEMSRRLLRGSRATGRMTKAIEIRESDFVPTPVALGIARPVIVLPGDWREWDAAKLDAVLAHERSHIRRHDPAVQLLSSIHRALLWHSPLSWFLHRRIVRVAEEASDDAAVAEIGDRATYAEALLDFMQRRVRGSAWQSVAMARYGRAEERIHRILDGTALSRGVTRWSVAAILALGSPLAYVAAAAHPQAPLPATPATAKPFTFDAASVKAATPLALAGVADGNGNTTNRKQPGGGRRPSEGFRPDDPGRIYYRNISLKTLLLEAYGVPAYQLQGPGWLDTERFDIEATMPPETTREQFRLMLQSLLSERFKLAIHRETKELPGYALVVAKNGPKLKDAAKIPPVSVGVPANARPPLDADGFMIPPRRAGEFFQLLGGNAAAHWTFQQTTMQDLANDLQDRLRGPVTDATGLTAKYDFALTLSTEDMNLGAGPIAIGPGKADAPPNLFNALQSQAGLKLEARKAPVKVIVIDRMERTPTAN